MYIELTIGELFLRMSLELVGSEVFEVWLWGFGI